MSVEFAVISGSLPRQHIASLVCERKGRPPDVKGSWGCTEQAVSTSRQGTVAELGGWAMY
jgi:hypothetical protein